MRVNSLCSDSAIQVLVLSRSTSTFGRGLAHQSPTRMSLGPGALINTSPLNHALPPYISPSAHRTQSILLYWDTTR